MIYEQLRQQMDESLLQKDESLAKYTSFRVGGPCDCMVTPRTPEELAMWAEKCTAEPAFAKAVGQAGRLRCLADHRWDSRADAFLRCLR